MPNLGKQRAHVCVHGSVRGVSGCVVFLICVSGVDHCGLVEIVQTKVGLQLELGVAICARTLCFHLNLLSRDKVLDDVRTTVLYSSIYRWLSSAQEKVYGSHSAISLHLVEIRLQDLDRWVAVAKVEKHSRGAHSAEGSCGDNIHLAYGSCRT